MKPRIVNTMHLPVLSGAFAPGGMDRYSDHCTGLRYSSAAASPEARSPAFSGRQKIREKHENR
jgi:hypothetical protein